MPGSCVLHLRELRGIRKDFPGERTFDQVLKRLGRILTGEKGHSKLMKEYEQSWGSGSKNSVSLAGEVRVRGKLRKIAGVGQVFGGYIT